MPVSHHSAHHDCGLPSSQHSIYTRWLETSSNLIAWSYLSICRRFPKSLLTHVSGCLSPVFTRQLGIQMSQMGFLMLYMPPSSFTASPTDADGHGISPVSQTPDPTLALDATWTGPTHSQSVDSAIRASLESCLFSTLPTPSLLSRSTSSHAWISVTASW